MKSAHPTSQSTNPLANSEDEIPAGWCIAELGTVAELVSGSGFPLKYQGMRGLTYPFLKVGNLGDVESGAELKKADDTVDKGTIHELRAKIIPPDSVLFAKIGMAIGLNRRRLAGVPCCIDNNMMAAIPTKAILPWYLLRFLEIVPFMGLASATTVPSLRKSELDQVPVFLPPLAEQKRIVGKIEELLAHVNASRARLANVSQILKRFRQAVLAAACSGRLTEDWRRRKEVDSCEWTETTLDKIADMRLGKMLDKAKNRGTPTHYLRNLNVRWFSFDVSNLALMRATPEDQDELAIKDGDLLVCEGGEPGRCAVWNLGPTKIIFQKAIHRVRLRENISPKFVAFSLKNDADSGVLEDYFTGSTIKHLTGRSLATFRLRLPPAEEQHEIVRRVDALFKLADAIEKRVEAATTRAEKLTQAILAKAFRGELVPTEAELARREGRDYEPASVLLERIRAEREPQPRRGRTRKHSAS